MSQTRNGIDPREMTRDFDAASPHGDDDVRLPPGDHYAIHVAAHRFRTTRHMDWSEVVMWAMFALCSVGVAGMVLWGW